MLQASFDGSGNLGAFSAISNALAVARLGAEAQVIGDYLYVIGGGATAPFSYGSNQLTSVERAQINSDGSLGAFSVLPGVILVAARHQLSSLVTGPYLYLIGGNYPGLSTVERAPINPDGSIGTFATVGGVTLVQRRGTHAGVRVGNYYYVLGGESDPGALDSVERASIDPGGILGTFSSLPGKLSQKRNRISPAALDGKLHLLGGWASGSGFLTTIDAAPITQGGDLGAFAIQSMTLAKAAASGVAWLTPTAVYFFGGYGASGMESAVQKALIQ